LITYDILLKKNNGFCTQGNINPYQKAQKSANGQISESNYT